ncbi:MAG: S9 family peptidase, partial [Gemmatimonadota bacterium]
MKSVSTLTSRRALRAGVAAIGALAAASAPLHAQEGQGASAIEVTGYLTPPPEIEEALTAPWHTNVNLNDADPTGRFFVLVQDGQRMPPIERYAAPYHNLGGLQVDPRANRNRRFTLGAASTLRLRSWQDGRDIDIRVPDGARVSNATFSPDGSRLAFFAHFDDATHIYTADPASGRARRLTRTPVLATLVTDFEWSGDNRYIFTVLVPEDRGREPAPPAVATTPSIWIAEAEEERPTRTYPSLLETPYEFELLEHHTVGQLARIQVDNRRVTTIGEPAMIRSIDPSPSAEHVIVTTVTEYSDIVPVSAFGTTERILDVEGNALVTLAVNEPRDGRDRDEDEDRKRFVQWRPDGQGLSYVERPQRDTAEADAEEGEEEKPSRNSRNDRVLQWLPPFEEGTATLVHEVDGRASGVAYTDDAGMVFVTKRSGGKETVYAAPVGVDTTYTIYSHETDDFYDDPGSLQTRRGSRGERVVRTSADGHYVYLGGTEYSEEPLENAPRPFVDRVTIETGETGRIWQSAADRYEMVAAVLDDSYGRIVVSRQSPTDVPQSHLLEPATGEERQLTENRNFAPDITSRAQRHVLQAERPDGTSLWVQVALPEDYRPGTRLPAMFWFYPREYETAEDYAESKRRYNKNRFPGLSPRSMDHLLRRGWAVVQPDVAIIGEDNLYNDNYVVHLRNSLAVVIDSLAERGWVDRGKLAIGGHSYGGFGTLNALIHTPFFKAGIAGASNT